MRIAYFDCFSGISGDMCLAALIDSGASLERVQRAVESFPLGVSLSVTAIRKHAFRGLSLQIQEQDIFSNYEQYSIHYPLQPNRHSASYAKLF